MKFKNLLNILTIAAFFITIGTWQKNVFASTVLTFDDMTGVTLKVNVYEGFDWDGGVVGWQPVSPDNPAPFYLYSNNYYPNTAVSGTQFLLKGIYGYSPTITWLGSGTFDFIGAYFKSLSSYSNVRFHGYKDGNPVPGYDTGYFYMDTTSTTWKSFNWIGIDEIRTSSSTGGDNRWVMDNFTYSPTVPIPGAVLLLGSGFLCLIGYRRKMKN